MSTKLPTLKLIAIYSLGVAAVFGVLSIIFYAGDWDRLLFVSLFGCCVGALSVSVIEPKYFKALSRDTDKLVK